MPRLLTVLLVGLFIGIAGTLAFYSWLSKPEDHEALKAKLAEARQSADEARQARDVNQKSASQFEQDSQKLARQVEELTTANQKLTQELAAYTKSAAAPAASPIPAPNPTRGVMKATIAAQYAQKAAILKARLRLTPFQEQQVQAALEVELKGVQEAAEAYFQNGKFNSAKAGEFAKAATLDKALESILTPEQKNLYEGIKKEERASQVETMATMELNQIAPSLQITETQKDEMYRVLYRTQMNMFDTKWISDNLVRINQACSRLRPRRKWKRCRGF